jgi:hypothetical protein
VRLEKITYRPILLSFFLFGIELRLDSQIGTAIFYRIACGARVSG